ncbi:hypothetical protein PF003_g38172 [Phytophthora fragariae]|nr:hypothetical protein PF003_g38172 [Phytophthora fragariae]
MAEEVWFQLVQASEDQQGTPFSDASEDAVQLTDDIKDVRHLREAIREKYRHEEPDILEGFVPNQLKIYANQAAYKAKKQCSPRLSLNELDARATVIVEVPTQRLVPRTAAPAAELMEIPSTIVLNEPDKYAKECTSLTEWAINAVHEIPLIWKFMSSLGGCTSNGKIFWRSEDKQVASILVDGWFRESTDGNINVRTNKKSILMGSPGIGKSTLLCVMAFYLVFKYKKNVLVYRRLTKFEQENCLFYLGYEDGKDLWLVGHLVYNFATKDMEERFYYSGGSVREFTLATSEDIRNAIDEACSGVDDISNLLSNNSSVLAGKSQVDRLRHTFVKNADDTNQFIARRYWEQVIDSEYAVLRLSTRLRSDALFRIYAWARSAGHGSLAGTVFEVYVHRLAADNMLRLQISEYDQPAFRKPNEPRAYAFKPLLLRAGTAAQWGTSDDYKSYLEKWRDDDEHTYWFPACDNFPNIDSIVKLESTASGKKGGVAYLQVTIAEQHDISSTQLTEMDTIFGVADIPEPPIYIAICPDPTSCQTFVLNPRNEVLLTRRTRRVFVGYFEEYQLATAADGPMNNISVKPAPPEHNYDTRNKRQRSS